MSYETGVEARAAGEELLARMKGDGWRLRIWENLGWHISVINWPVAVNEYRRGKYCASMTDDPEEKDVVATPVYFPKSETWDDPNDAVGSHVASVEIFADKIFEAAIAGKRIVDGDVIEIEDKLTEEYGPLAPDEEPDPEQKPCGNTGCDSYDEKSKSNCSIGVWPDCTGCEAYQEREIGQESSTGSAGKVPQMLVDDREVESIWFADDEQYIFRVGLSGIIKILVYPEPGHFGWVPWVAVYRGKEIVSRIPAGQVSIHYKEG